MSADANPHCQSKVQHMQWLEHITEGFSMPTLKRRQIELSPSLFLILVLAFACASDGFATTRKSNKERSGKVRIQNIRNGSEETSAERDRRLYRECQGRPNSGACLGYTNKRLDSRR